MNHSAFNLLLNLDAMFDTRMGTLLGLSDDVPSFLPLQEYRNRTMDDFEKLTGGKILQADFDAAYAARNIETLRRSKISGVIPVLMAYVDSLQERFFRGVDVSSISIDINLHPYVLPGPIVQTIKDCLRTLMPTYVNINHVSLDREKLGLDFLRTHYSGWVTYDIHHWLERYHEELLLKPLNGLSAIIPKLYKRELGDMEGPEKEVFKDVDHHGLFEMIMEDFIHLEHIPVSDFCFIVPGTYKLPGDQDSSSASAAAERSDASTAPTNSS